MNHRRTVALCLLLGALGAPPASGAESEPARSAEISEDFAVSFPVDI